MNYLIRTERGKSPPTRMAIPEEVRDARAPAGMPTAEVDNDQVGPRMCSQGDKTQSHPTSARSKGCVCLTWQGRELAKEAKAIWTGSVCSACPREYLRMSGRQAVADCASKSWKVPFIKY